MKHNNTSISKQINDVFKPKGESMPSEVSDEVSLVYDITPMTEIVATAEATASTSATIYTTPADRDFFITGFSISHIRDGTATALYFGITAVINGSTTFLVKIPIRSLLAVTTPPFGYVILPKPLKIDRGTAISVVNDTNVAVVRSIATIYGYLTE